MNGQSIPQTGRSVPPVFGFSIADVNDRFLRYLESAFRLYADVQELDYVLANADNSVTGQYQQIRNMIQNAGIQGLVVVPTDTTGMQPVTDLAQAADIPLVYLNRQPYPLDALPPNVYYIGSDPANAGEMQANFLAENLGEGNVAILMGTPELENTIRRTRGLEDSLRLTSPNIHVIARESANFQREPAYEITKQWLAQFGSGLNAIAANNDEMALGAIEALREAGRSDVMVVGIDGLTPGRQAVQQGLMAATVFQDASRQGELAVNLMSQLLRGERPEQRWTLVPHILITAGQRGDNPPS